MSAPLLLKMASWYGLLVYSAQSLSQMSNSLNLYPPNNNGTHIAACRLRKHGLVISVWELGKSAGEEIAVRGAVQCEEGGEAF